MLVACYYGSALLTLSTTVDKRRLSYVVECWLFILPSFQENMRSKSLPGELVTTGMIHPDITALGMAADNADEVITNDKDEKQEENHNERNKEEDELKVEEEEKIEQEAEKEQEEEEKEEEEEEEEEEKEKERMEKKENEQKEREEEVDAEVSVAHTQPKGNEEVAEPYSNGDDDRVLEPETSSLSKINTTSSKSQAEANSEQPHQPSSTSCIQYGEPREFTAAQQSSDAERRSGGGRKGAKKQRPPKRIRDKLKINSCTPVPGVTEDSVEKERGVDLRKSEGTRANDLIAHIWPQYAEEQVSLRGK